MSGLIHILHRAGERTVERHVQIDPGDNALRFIAAQPYQRLTVLVGMSGEHQINQFAARRAPTAWFDFQDVLLDAVEAGDPIGVRILDQRVLSDEPMRRRRLAAHGQRVVGNAEELCPLARQSHAGRRIRSAMALDAVLVQHRLDDCLVVKPDRFAPLGRLQRLRRPPKHFGREPRFRGQCVARRVTADATLDFAGHQVRVAAHSLHRPPFPVQGQKEHRLFGRDLKIRRAVVGHVGKTPDDASGIRCTAGDGDVHHAEPAAAAAALGVPRAFLDNADPLDGTSFHVRFQTAVDVLHEDGRPRSGLAARRQHRGRHGRPRSGP